MATTHTGLSDRNSHLVSITPLLLISQRPRIVEIKHIHRTDALSTSENRSGSVSLWRCIGRDCYLLELHPPPICHTAVEIVDAETVHVRLRVVVICGNAVFAIKAA
jgi:hypothetical protein